MGGVWEVVMVFIVQDIYGVLEFLRIWLGNTYGGSRLELVLALKDDDNHIIIVVSYLSARFYYASGLRKSRTPSNTRFRKH